MEPPLRVISKFLKDHDLDLICRSHQICEDGYKFFCNKSLLTIFSAQNYCGEYDNEGGILTVDEEMKCDIRQLTKEKKKKIFKKFRSVTPIPGFLSLERER